jgi:hypothetical protein
MTPVALARLGQRSRPSNLNKRRESVNLNAADPAKPRREPLSLALNSLPRAFDSLSMFPALRTMILITFL